MPGPMITNLLRREVAEHTTVYAIQNLKILSGLTGLKVDPWGFLLPFKPLVWASTLTALLAVLAVQQVLMFTLPGRTSGRYWAVTIFNSVRVILQQGKVLEIVLGFCPLLSWRLKNVHELKKHQSCHDGG